MKSGFANIKDTHFYYEVAGEGRPVVLVHAGIADNRMWDAQFAAFAERFQVIRYDRRGFGQTRVTSAAYSHHEDLYDLLQFLGIERAFLLGCSQGGKTVVDFTLEHPEMTGALVLVASALGGFEWTGDEPTQLRELEQAEESGDVELVNELELQIWVDGAGRGPHEVDSKVRELVREMNRIALHASSDPGTERPLDPPAVHRLGEIHAPTLIITGSLDTRKTLEAARFLAENIGGSQKLFIEDTAHLPNMERPQEFNRRVLSFLAGIE